MRRQTPSKQSGAALLVTLVILVLLTLMGLTTMKSALIQERMSGGSADKALAFQAAEMALRDAEHHIRDKLTSSSPFADGCAASLCLPPTDGSALADSVDWDGGAPVNYGSATGAAALGGVARQPRYIIELLPDMTPPLGNSVSAELKGTPFRITALGFGKQPNTRVMLQTTYFKP